MVATLETTSRTTRSAIAHLARRAGFGLAADAIDALAANGYEAAVDQVIASLGSRDPASDAVPTPAFGTRAYLDAVRATDPNVRMSARQLLRADRRALLAWWLGRVTASALGTREKLTFLWHDHFATSAQKVRITELLHRQYQTLYELGPGPFDALVKAVARDPAMLIWLDGRESTARAPNENFARELFELFTLGHGGHGGHDHTTGHETGRTEQAYTEADVADAARALTGWTFGQRSDGALLVPARHDTGTKTVLGRTGALGLDDVVELAVNHERCAPHVTTRLWSRIGRPADPDDEVVQELAGVFARDRSTTALLRAMLLHDAFRDEETRGALVKMPVDYVVGTLRALRLPPDANAVPTLIGLGQVPFLPPDVAGWPANAAWLSTSSAQVRLEFAVGIAGRADLRAVIEAPVGDGSATVARMLGVDAWSDTTAAALEDAAGDPQTLLTLALVAPEYVVA